MTQHEKKAVLIVNGDQESRRLLRFRLERAGYRAVMTTKGSIALDVIMDGGKPDLIVTELVLPGLDGFGLIEGVRRQHTLQDLPIIVLTAQTLGGVRERALAAGANEFFTIPLEEPLALTAAIRRLLEAVPARHTQLG
ncbi:MAG: response regulator [Patescibacteria group bacterium]|mgnify:CR=1 FL=1